MKTRKFLIVALALSIYNKKNRRVLTIIVVVILILAMVIPIVASYLV